MLSLHAALPIYPYFNGSGLQVGDYFITAQQLITFAVAVAVAAALFVLLNRTRTGTAMRAVVDNRELLALHGARPNRLSGLSWAIGCRSEEHTSELQSLMRISYAVFGLKK